MSRATASGLVLSVPVVEDFHFCRRCRGRQCRPCFPCLELLGSSIFRSRFLVEGNILDGFWLATQARELSGQWLTLDRVFHRRGRLFRRGPLWSWWDLPALLVLLFFPFHLYPSSFSCVLQAFLFCPVSIIRMYVQETVSSRAVTFGSNRSV